MNNPFGFVSPEDRVALERFTAFAPVDLEGLADRLSVVIAGLGGVASLHYDFTNGQNFFYVDHTMTEGRQRYFIAKGLAAWMLKDKPNISDNTLVAIATEIIMPSRLVKEYCEINNCDPKYHGTIAKHFKVTLEALQLRLKQLGYSWKDESETA